MLMHTLNPSTWGEGCRSGWISVFKASLGYVVSSRLPKAI